MDIKKINIIDLLKYIPWIVLLIGFVFLIRQCGDELVTDYVVLDTEVLVPSVNKQFDTIYEPKPYPVKVVEIDSTYYRKYIQLKDSVAKDSMFKKAIEIKEYNEKFEDTLQIIDVYSKTRGDLLEQTVKYTTKPYYIAVKDSVEIKEKWSLSLGTEVGIPTVPTLNAAPILKANIVIKNRRDNTFSISYDTDGRFWVGKTWKIKLRK
jgi:hypothetical protein